MPWPTFSSPCATTPPAPHSPTWQVPAMQVVPAVGQLPQKPPQPLGPQTLPLQLGVHDVVSLCPSLTLVSPPLVSPVEMSAHAGAVGNCAQLTLPPEPPLGPHALTRVSKVTHDTDNTSFITIS